MKLIDVYDGLLEEHIFGLPVPAYYNKEGDPVFFTRPGQTAYDLTDLFVECRERGWQHSIHYTGEGYLARVSINGKDFLGKNASEKHAMARAVLKAAGVDLEKYGLTKDPKSVESGE